MISWEGEDDLDIKGNDLEEGETTTHSMDQAVNRACCERTRDWMM